MHKSGEHDALLTAEINSAHLKPSISSAVVEPQSWSQLAYTSFMWWASADEQASWLAEENDVENDLFQDLSTDEDAYAASLATAITTLMHRRTALAVKIVHDAIIQAETGPVIPLETVQQAGLDMWSQQDREFVVELATNLSKRQVKLSDDSLTVCGLRIC